VGVVVVIVVMVVSQRNRVAARAVNLVALIPDRRT